MASNRQRIILNVRKQLRRFSFIWRKWEIKPGVAESWDISEDGLTYTFHLNQDAKWVKADGTEVAPVTAHDFVYSWTKLIDPQSGAEYNFMLETAGVVGASDALGLANLT